MITLKKQHKRYKQYKHSDNEWIGDIPLEWVVMKLKYAAEILNGYSFDSNTYQDNGFPIIRIGDVGQKIDFTSVKRVPIELSGTIKKFKIVNRDILLALTGATIGKSSTYDYEEVSYLNQRVGIIRANSRFLQKYLSYFVNSEIFKENIKVACFGGAQENIGKPQIGKIILSFPSIVEQKAIATYLDNKTSLLDSIIEKKKQQIELLKEKRTALINKAVTSGLDDNAEMKDSGVEWIGEIPKGANFIKLSLVCDVRDGTHDTPQYVDQSDGVPFVTSKDLVNSKVNFENVKFISKKDHNQIKKRSYVEKGDVLMAMIGTIGNPCVVDVDFEFSIKNVALFKKRKIDLNFLCYYIISKMGNTFIDMKLSGGIQKFIGLNDIRALPVLFYSNEQQIKIVNYLDIETKKTDKAITLIEKSINLLQEYKTSLISNVVTGKVKITIE